MSSVVVPGLPGTPDPLVRGRSPAGRRPSSWERHAPVGVELLFVNLRLTQYDRLMARLDLQIRGAGLPGCLFHWASSVPDGVSVTEVWRSLKLFDFFLREDILPTVTALRLPDPEVSVYAVHHVMPTAGPRPHR